MRRLSGKTLRFSSASEVPDTGSPFDVEQQKSLWLGRLRWLAVVAQILCGFLGFHYGMLHESEIPVYLGIVAALAIYNLLWPFLRHHFSKMTCIPAVFFEMSLDLIALGTLLSITNGCTNPLFALIYLHAALGPLMLTGNWSKAYLLVTIACLGSVCLGSELVSHANHHGQSLPRELKLAAELFVVLVIWSLTHWFSRSLDSLKQTITGLQRQKQRGDHLRALGAMAASFSHEFSTPLNTAKIRVERVARRHPEVHTNSDYLASLTALDQCESILRGLFDSDQQIGAARFDEIELIGFVGRVCRSWQESQPSVKLKFNQPKVETGISCRVPQIVLARSIVDLLDNAVQASDGTDSLIEVEVYSKSKNAYLVIADRGRGVTRFIKDRLGDPFLSTRADGVGLGLFTANAMMDALGGIFRIDDRENGGTLVTLEFPI